MIGKNSVPVGAWVDTLDEALTIVNKRREADRFRSIVALTQGRHPAIVSYMARRPLIVLQYSSDWKKLLDITDWMLQHPRPDIFVRQVDIPGIHTKLIETYRGILREFFELVLPDEAIDQYSNNVSGFEKRYGFREKPVRIRFRILDPALTFIKCDGYQDITLDADSFITMQPNVSNVFITENETNYLAFTALPKSMVIFGAGYGLNFLAAAQWLQGCEVYYWGDIDTHGFAILNSARTYLPQLRSVLMDRQSLMAHEPLWVSEDVQHNADELAGLTSDEQRLYQDLKGQVLGRDVRLEQERIGWQYAWDRIKSISGSGKGTLSEL